MTADPTIIVGTGMAAWGAAERFRAEGIEPILYDRADAPGGHTRSFTGPDGFTFDDGPHVSFTSDPGLQERLAAAVDGEYEVIQTYVDNHWKGHWIKHPAQVNLHGLPDDLVVDCISDMVAARHGPEREVRTYEDWLRAQFGDTFAETFPMVYGEKYHTAPASQMSTDWLGPRLYQPDLREVLHGALSPVTADVHYVDHFRYPSRGGFESYLRRFHQGADLRLGREVTAVDPIGRTLTTADGSTASYERLVSSAPLPELVPRVAGAPPDVLAAAARLACTTCVIVNVGVDREDLSPAQWRYVYDTDVVFTRLSFPHLLSPHTVPPGCGSVQVECYYSDKYRPLDVAPEALVEPVVADLRRLGIVRDGDRILHRSVRPVRYANVIFDLDRAEALATVHGWLDEVGIAWCGRYGEWGYHWTDESYRSGEAAATRTLDRGR